MKINRLTFVRESIPGRSEFWIFRCDCGKEVEFTRRSVIAGKIKSCGCLNRELRIKRNTKHGLAPRGAKIPEYHIWQAMISRCHRDTNKDFVLYGMRGISVCDQWRRSFSAFIRDVGRRPSPELTIDRIDNNGNYEPGNVRWATQSQQALNRRPKYSSHRYQ